MVLTLAQIEDMLKDCSFECARAPDRDAVNVRLPPTVYRFGKWRGATHVIVQVTMEEGGRRVRLQAVSAIRPGPHADALQRACSILQQQDEPVVFEFEPACSTVRAIADLRLDGPAFGHRRLQTAVEELARHFHAYVAMLERALGTGIVEMPDLRPPADSDSSFWDELGRVVAANAAGKKDDGPPPVVH